MAGKEAAKGLRRNNSSLSQRADRSTSPKAISDNLTSRDVGRLESKASALDRQAKADALDSKCASLAETMIKAEQVDAA